MPGPAVRFDDARVHLEVLGHTREVQGRIRVGEAGLIDVLPLARAVTNSIAEIGEEAAREEGKAVSCRAGCGACCKRHVILVAPMEAVAIARLVSRLPAKRREVIRRRFAAGIRRLESLGLLDPDAPRGRMALRTPAPPARETPATSNATSNEDAWWQLSQRYFEATITCPFLDDERCSIYADRPVVCREFMATTPAERCDSFDAAETTPRPVYMTEVLADLSATVADVLPKAIPLLLALEWVEVHGEELETTIDGAELFARFTELVAAHATTD